MRPYVRLAKAIIVQAILDVASYDRGGQHGHETREDVHEMAQEALQWLQASEMVDRYCVLADDDVYDLAKRVMNLRYRRGRPRSARGRLWNALDVV